MLNVTSDGTIQLTRGDTARFSVSIDNSILNGPYVITERDALTFTVKKKWNDESTCIQKTVIGSNLLHIEPNDTNNLEVGKYTYDVQLTTEFGDVYTVIPPSTFEILKEVTY